MDKDEVDIARQIRTNSKTKITKFSTFLEKCINDSQSSSVEEIQLRLKKLEDTWSEYDKAQLTLELVAPGPNLEIERTEFENNYFKWVAVATKLINERSTSVNHGSVSESDEVSRHRNRIAQLEAELHAQREAEIAHLRGLSGSRAASSDSGAATVRMHFPLPKLDLPTFSGKYEEWLGFKDTFMAIIHNDSAIPKVQKLRYLKSYVRGSAAQVIENIEISEASYEEAWKLLEDRYDNKRVIIQNHMMALFDLKTPGKESALGLREFLDSISRHIRALKVLNEPTESWDTPLICLVASNLDRDSRREWERSLKGSEMPTFKLLVEFLRERCQLLEALNPAISDQSKQNLKTFNKGNSNSENRYSSKSLLNTQSIGYCKLCKEENFVQNCTKFLELSPNDRLQLAKRKGLCFNCLRGNHLINDCKSRNCTVCNKRHHTLLHFESQSASNANKEKEIKELTLGKNVHVNHVNDSSSVILSTAIINIVDSLGNRHNCRVILDSGSQPNIMTKQLADKLKLSKKRIHSAIEAINNTELNSFEWVNARLESKHSNYNVNLSFLILPKITSDIPSIPINKIKLNIPPRIGLADPTFDRPARIDALIGAELFYDILGRTKIPLSVPHASLQNTKLGWIVTGSMNQKQAQVRLSCNLVRDSLSHQLEKFWRIEEDKEVKHLSMEESNCEKHFEENVQRDSLGKYTVRLPFNARKEELGDSYEVARRRFFVLERKLSKNLDLKEKYHKFMREYEELNHMELSKSKRNEGYYMPHQAVVKESSITTKVRVVFDASAKTSTGVSLNETLMVGPTIQDSIAALMMRFRSHPIALSADVEKMYRQFWIHQDDQKFQKILWRFDENQPIRTYQLRTVTYGTSAAPFLAIRCLKELSKDEESSFPEAARVLRQDFYVDDLLTGAESPEEAQELENDLTTLTSKGGLHLCKWKSNSREIIQEENRDAGVLRLDLDHASKTLGVMWDSREDDLFFKVDASLQQRVTSKRSMLSQIAKLYDPLGIIAPVIVYAKIKMQELWKTNSSWDDPIPPKILSEYEMYQDQLHLLSDWKLKSAVRQQGSEEIQIHGFADASEKAYGAGIYIRTRVDGRFRINLLCAKSRVAPVKIVTLPRLELCAAVLLARLLKTVKESLKIKVDQVKLWSDSTIVLSWINSSPHEFNTFVGNRIAEIQSLTIAEMWGHVISEQNPADFVSRGQLPAEFVDNSLWRAGPEWLLLPEQQWPKQSFNSSELPERKKGVILIATKSNDKLDLLKRFSSLTELIRVTAYCLRVADKARKCPFSGPLTTNELNRALVRIITLVQGEEFSEEIIAISRNEQLPKKSKLLRLSPIWREGLLRVGGRIIKSELTYQQQHPILIPKQHPFTDLVIRYYHEHNMHAGINATLYSVRAKYWPVDGRSEVRRILNSCVRCFRARPKEPLYVMGNLPKTRVTASRPFENSGVDYCGPFYVKEKRLRNRGQVKVYAAVFVCLSTKAVHIEIVGDLSTELFWPGCVDFLLEEESVVRCSLIMEQTSLGQRMI